MHDSETYRDPRLEPFRSLLAQIESPRFAVTPGWAKSVSDATRQAAIATYLPRTGMDLISPMVHASLVQWLTSGRMELQLVAAEVLSSMHDRQAFERFSEWLYNPAPELRRLAVRSIGRWETSEVMALLVRASADDDVEVQRAAAEWLAYYSRWFDVYEVLLALFQSSDDEEVWMSAAGGLGGAANPACLPAVLPVTQSKCWQRRLRAIYIIGDIISKMKDLEAVEALDALRRALHDPKPQVRKAAKSGLARWQLHRNRKH